MLPVDAEVADVQPTRIAAITMVAATRRPRPWHSCCCFVLTSMCPFLAIAGVPLRSRDSGPSSPVGGLNHSLPVDCYGSVRTKARIPPRFHRWLSFSGEATFCHIGSTTAVQQPLSMPEIRAVRPAWSRTRAPPRLMRSHAESRLSAGVWWTSGGHALLPHPQRSDRPATSRSAGRWRLGPSPLHQAGWARDEAVAVVGHLLGEFRMAKVGHTSPE